MRDVAALAGVGLRTVSRVINDDPTVGGALRAQVQRAVDQLHYRPNLISTQFRRRDGRSFAVGLILHDVANPFLAVVQRAVQDVARSHGCDVLTASGTDDADREREVVERLIARRVEGLIIMPATDDHSYLQTEQMAGTAIVFLDRPPAFLAADSVLVDNRKGAAKGVRHLLTGGHRRIAYLGYRASTWTNQQRYLGYCDALRGRGVALELALVRQDLSTAKAAEEATSELMSQPGAPTALFTAQASATIGAVRALRSLKQSETTALVGFSDFDTADLLEPGITVVAQDPVEMGSLATEILFRRIKGDRSPISQHVLKATLVQRGSGEIRPSFSSRT
ncbi:MAG: LacI family DNA-binding transcriptional regulator [Acidimicrobiales bacterium]|jgi:LacI family transcriptional regulator